MVRKQVFQGDRHRSALAGGTQPWVEFVQPTIRTELVNAFDNALAELTEEVLIGRAARAAMPRVDDRVAVAFVDENDIEIALIQYQKL